MAKTSRSAQAPVWKKTTTLYEEGPASVTPLPQHHSRAYLSELLDKLVNAEATFFAESQLGHYLQGGVPGCKRCALQSLKVQAIATTLASLCRDVINWSLDTNAQQRSSLTDVVAEYAKPLMHTDPAIRNLCEDIERLPSSISAKLSKTAGTTSAQSLEKRQVHEAASQPGYALLPSLTTSAPGKLTRISDFSTTAQPRTQYGAVPRIAVEMGSWAGRKFLFENPTYHAWEVSEQESEEEAVPEALPPPPVELVVMPPPPLQRLRVVIVSAKNLADTDTGMAGGASDAYCVCKILSKPQLEFKTPVISSCNPEWHHDSRITDWAVGDDLQFEVFDKDTLSSEALGKCTLESKQFHFAGFAGELSLQDAGTTEDARLRVEVFLPVWVKMTVLRAWNLSQHDSDSYVILQISSQSSAGKGHGEVKTPVIKSVNPEWRLPVVLKEFFHGEKIDFNVWDSNWGSDEMLGKTQISSKDIHHGMQEADEAGICVYDLPLLGSNGKPLPSRPLLRVAFALPLPHKLTLVSLRGLPKHSPYVNVSIAGRAFANTPSGWQDSLIPCFKTPHVKDDKGEAVWNADFQSIDFYYGERYVFEILDSQWGRDGVLGHSELTCDDISASLVDGITTLDVPVEGTKSAGPVKLRVQVALPMPLRIKIVGARNLKKAGGLSGESDSYVFVQKVGDGPDKEVYRTKVIKSSNPVWDEMTYVPAFYHDEKLKFTVYDSNYGRDSVLGIATLSLQQLQRGAFVGKLLLTNTGMKDEVTLSVDVLACVPIPPPPEEPEDEGKYFFHPRTQQTIREVSVQTPKPQFEQLGSFTGKYTVTWTPAGDEGSEEEEEEEEG